MQIRRGLGRHHGGRSGLKNLPALPVNIIVLGEGSWTNLEVACEGVHEEGRFITKQYVVTKVFSSLSLEDLLHANI
jgi:hypothetical protein